MVYLVSCGAGIHPYSCTEASGTRPVLIEIGIGIEVEKETASASAACFPVYFHGVAAMGRRRRVPLSKRFGGRPS